MIVGVTGVQGYVGSRIAAYLRAQGHNVVGFSRNPGAQRRFVLGSPVPPSLFEGVEVLVHAAYDFDAATWPEISRINVNGTAELLDAACVAGVQRLIVISTISAFEGCVSLYGRAKLLIEQHAFARGGFVVRPGLVYDEQAPGGMVAALERVARTLPVIPLVGGGGQRLYTCHVDDLSSLVSELVHTSHYTDKPITAAATESLTFRQILVTLASRHHRRPLFVPIPAVLPLAVLRAFEALGVRARIRSDSLISLLNPNPRVDFSPLSPLPATFRAFHAAAL